MRNSGPSQRANRSQSSGRSRQTYCSEQSASANSDAHAGRADCGECGYFRMIGRSSAIMSRVAVETASSQRSGPNWLR